MIAIFYGSGTRHPMLVSATTDFIGNFQRDPRFKDSYWPWFFKNQALQHAAAAINKTILPEWQASVFVPVPPSKVKGNPRHDSRLIDTLVMARQGVAESHELVLQTNNTESRQKDIHPTFRASNWTLSLRHTSEGAGAFCRIR